MTFRWIEDHGMARKMLGERRTDHSTAACVDDALRAGSVHAAARALEHRCVSLDTALRLLAMPHGRRRGPGS